MAKHKHNRYTEQGLKALQHGATNVIGPLANPRHPRKLKLAPMDKKTAPSAVNTEGGRGET